MKIGVFGCSFSSFQAPIAWPEIFATLVPEHEVYNLSTGATSLQWSINNLLHFKELYPDSFTILQITTPFRYTHISDTFDIMEYVTHKENNYYNLDCKVDDDVLKYTGGRPQEKRRDKRVFRFYQDKMVYNTYERLEFRSLVYYAQQHSDIIFSHKTHVELEELKDIVSIESLLDKHMKKKFVYDKQLHFNEAGAIWQADYIHSLFREHRRIVNEH